VTTSTKAPLELSREQILGHRRRAGFLGARLPSTPESLRRAAWAGLQDSMPRAAVLSINARVVETQPGTWEDPAYVQVWGPRFSAYVVPAKDLAAFTLGRLSDNPRKRAFAQEMAARLETFLDGRRMSYADVGHGLGLKDVNAVRYAAPTGCLLMRWEGAGRPTIWTVPPPKVDPGEARIELARRYLNVLGPGTPASFAGWAGIRPPGGEAPFEALEGSLIAVRTPVGEAWILSADEASFRSAPDAGAPARLLPSGDAYYLFQDARDRELVVPDAAQRAALWTSRVWPGAVLVGGAIVGTWRRAGHRLTVEPWRALTSKERADVEAEAGGLPLPDLARQVEVEWGGG
jgi:hypothetical protein